MMQESTIKTMMQSLKAAFKWAVRQKLIPECPNFPSVKPPKKKPRPVPIESVEKLLAKAPDENMRVFLLSAWLGGLRLNEALSLEWEETDKALFLDLVHDRIIFPATFVKATEDQWLPLDQDLREAICALPRRGKKVFCFLSKRGQQRILSPTRIADSISKLAKKAGVRMTMKTLRSGFGCYWAARVPAQVLQKLMRHANIKTTMDYYVNVQDAVVEAIFSRPRNSLRNIGPASEKAKQSENDLTASTEDGCV
jgi:integrase